MARLFVFAWLGLSLVFGVACQRDRAYDPEVDQGLLLYSGKSSPWSHHVVPICIPSPGSEGISGQMTVGMLITQDGAVADAWLQKSDVTTAGCDSAAVAAMKETKFWPSLKDGKPVRIRTHVFLSYPGAFSIQSASQ
jgi:TonB family protein